MKKNVNAEVVKSRFNPDYKGIKVTFIDDTDRERHMTLIVYRMCSIELVHDIDDGGTICEKTVVNLDEIVRNTSRDTSIILIHALASEVLNYQGIFLGDSNSTLWAFCAWAYDYIYDHKRCYNVALNNAVSITAYHAIKNYREIMNGGEETK